MTTIKTSNETHAPQTSRRLFLFGAVAAVAVPSIAIAQTAGSEAARLWCERQPLVNELNALIKHADALEASMPDWAKEGPRNVTGAGIYSAECTTWPMHADYLAKALASGDERIHYVIRPSIDDCKERFRFDVQIFKVGGAARAKSRAAYRRNVKAIVTLLREQKRLRSEAGLTTAYRDIDTTIDRLFANESEILALPYSPDAHAAQVILAVCQDAMQDDYAKGAGYSGAMHVAAMTLQATLPSLSPGLIRDHATFFVENQQTPLRAMPFATS
jgi:hypothetical protein